MVLVWMALMACVAWGVWRLARADEGVDRWLWGKPPKSSRKKPQDAVQPKLPASKLNPQRPDLRSPFERLGDWTGEQPWYVQLLMWQFVLSPLIALRLLVVFFGIAILLYFTSGGGAP
jgi:hypothetical protein